MTPIENILMDMDMVVDINAGMRTILVLTGVTKEEDIANFPYQPTMVKGSIGEMEVPEGNHNV